MDGTALKKTFNKTTATASLFFKFTITALVLLVVGVLLHSPVFILGNLAAIIICFPIAVYNQKLSIKALNLYTWKYDADDLFDEDEDELNN